MSIRMFRYLIIMVLFFAVKSMAVYGQNGQAITLKYCQDEALANYPSAKDKTLIQAASELKLSGLQSGYLPQVSLNGQATYQSDGIKYHAFLYQPEPKA